MPAERISMRQLREILRLLSAGDVAVREIARRTGVAPSTVRETVKRLQEARLSWPLPEGFSDAELGALLYQNAGKKPGHRRYPEPDWAAMHRELKRKHVTLSILWDEYIEQHPDGFRYSRFCELYRAGEGNLPVTMRQMHLGGEKLFIDCAGDTVPVIVDRRDAALVAAMGASSFTYAEVTRWAVQLTPLLPSVRFFSRQLFSAGAIKFCCG